MGANPNVQPRQKLSLRKLPASEPAKPSRLDIYGRDTESPVEKLRGLSDYNEGTGFSPFFDAMMADLPRLLGESGYAWAFVVTLLRLSLGRWRKTGEARHEWTLPISVEELATYCQCGERQIQRFLGELADRGVILKRSAMRGKVAIPGTYELSLPLRDWRKLDDYAVWKRKQAVPITKGVEPDEPADDDQLEVSRDAVHLTKRPQVARPGRALRAMKVPVGVRDLVMENGSSAANVAFESRVEPGGRMVVSATISAAVAIEAVPDKPSDKPSDKRGDKLHARAPEVAAVFDPLLQRAGVPLLSFDPVALNAAAGELGTMPILHLEAFLTAPRGRDSHSARAARPISSGKACVAIVRECRLNWAASTGSVDDTAERDGLLKDLGLPSWENIVGMSGRKAAMSNLRDVLSRSVNDPDFTTGQQNAAARLLEILK